MDMPGMSLFQGAGSLHINNSAEDRQEEQEALEDAKRRKEELEQNLNKHFGDFEDDDQSSVNTSANHTLDEPGADGRHFINGIATGMPGLPHNGSPHHLKDHCLKKQYRESPLAHTPVHHQPNQYTYSPHGAGDGLNHQYQTPEHREHQNGLYVNDIRAGLITYEQEKSLQLMYELKVKECDQLASENRQLRCESERDMESLRARITAALNDKQKAETSLNEAHQLLTQCKQEKFEFLHQMDALKHQLMLFEQEREQMKLEIQSANLALQEEQHKTQKFMNSHMHNADALFREAQDRHKEETDKLFHDLQRVKNRLEEKENDIKKLERQCKEKDREKEQLLIEKSATVNRLASELDAAQSQLASGEASKLKEKLAKLSADRDKALKQVNEFGSKLESTANELVLQRTKLKNVQEEYESWRQNLQQIINEHVPHKQFQGEMQSPGKLSSLKEILTWHKQQLHKMKNMQEEMAQQDKRLEHHRRQESDLRTKLEEQKSTEVRLNSRVAMLQSKLDLLASASDSHLAETYRQQINELTRQIEDLQAECKSWQLKLTETEMELDRVKSERSGRTTLVQETNADLLKELEKYSTQLKNTLKDNADLNTLYLQACSARTSLEREYKELQNRVQNEKSLKKDQEKEYVERLEQQRQRIDSLTAELAACKDELDGANKRIAELQKDFNNKQKEFTEKLDKYLEEEKSSMRKGLTSCEQCEKHLKTIQRMEEQIVKFNLKIATQASNEELMRELKLKAESFKEYILERYHKLQEQRHVGTNTDVATDVEVVSRTEVTDATACKPPADDEDEIASRTKMMVQEKEMREQLAHKFTQEIKTVETNCAKQIKELENQHQHTLSQLKQLLETKAGEVETLKEFVLNERANVTQILTAKENEISMLIKEHNSIQTDYQNLKEKYTELKHKLEKYQEKLKHLEDRYKNDKESSRKSVGEVEKERDYLSDRVKSLEAEYQQLKNKYKNVKKTAYMYKEYISQKDEHTNKELARIQNEYKDVFLKLEDQIKCYVNLRVKETGNLHNDNVVAGSARAPETYSDVINRLQSDIAALAQSSSSGVDNWTIK